MRNISFALTTRQFRNWSKDVTRRLGWRDLKPGTKLMGVVKSRGIPKGGKVEKLGLIHVDDVRRERLDAITAEDVWREGFPGMTPAGFVAMFCAHNGCRPDQEVTRIEYRYVLRSEGRGRGVSAKAGAKPDAKPAPAIPPEADRVLSMQQIAVCLAVTPRMIRKMVAAGEYPQPDANFCRFPRWTVDVHNAWIARMRNGG